jgi:hypothetical protein
MTDTSPRDLIQQLAGLARRMHYTCEDSWYNCPKSEDGSANDCAGTECDCGADKHNAKVDAICAYLSQPEPEATITEPRGCPTPGACSCPTAPYVPPELIRALELAEAALADISDTEREPWSEARAAQDLPRIRAVLARWGRSPQ